jgi:hypothetical protein
MTPEQQLTAAKQELRNLQVMARRPRQPAAKLELLVNLQRSAKAEIKLLEKHLAWVIAGRPILHTLGYPKEGYDPKRILAQRYADNHPTERKPTP